MDIFDFHIHPGPDAPTERVLAFLDEIGAARGAVLATDHGWWGRDHGTQISNEYVAALCAAAGGRLTGIASVCPAGPEDPAPKLEKALDLGLKGLKLYPHSGFYPNDRALDETYALARDRNIPVLIHTGVKAHRDHRMIFNEPLYIDDVAVRFPGLKLVVMHAGYPWLEETLLLSRLNENVWVDLTFLDVLDYTFQEGLLEDTLRRFLRVLGADKLVWGSEGWELGLPAYRDEGTRRVTKCLEKLRSFPFLTESDTAKLLGATAASLLP